MDGRRPRRRNLQSEHPPKFGFFLPLECGIVCQTRCSRLFRPKPYFLFVVNGRNEREGGASSCSTFAPLPPLLLPHFHCHCCCGGGSKPFNRQRDVMRREEESFLKPAPVFVRKAPRCWRGCFFPQGSSIKLGGLCTAEQRMREEKGGICSECRFWRGVA